MTLDELFARMCELQPEMLRGKDVDGRWEQRRFAFEIHSNRAGTWTVTVTDDKRVMQQGWKPGDEMALSVDSDPRAAIEQALSRMGLLK